MASPSSSYMLCSSENSSNKRYAIPLHHTATTLLLHRLVQHRSLVIVPVLNKAHRFILGLYLNRPLYPYYLSPYLVLEFLPSLILFITVFPWRKRVVKSNIRPSLPTPVDRGSKEFCVGVCSSLPPRRGHRRSSSDFPLGFSAMIQSSLQSNSIVNPAVHEPVQLVKRELADDLFNAYMNSENLETLNSSGTEDRIWIAEVVAQRPMEVKVVTMKCGVNGHPINSVKRSVAGDIAPIPTVGQFQSVSMDSFKGSLQFDDDSTKRNRGVHCSTNSMKLRILANRQSAARSKERRMRYIAELEHKVQTLKMEATTLSAQLTTYRGILSGLTSQKNELKFRLQAIEQQARLKDGIHNDVLICIEAYRQSLSVNHSRFSAHPQRLNADQAQQQWRTLEMSSNEAENKVEMKGRERGGELLFCGSTSRDIVGRRKGPVKATWSPTRLRPLIGVNIRFVTPVACHVTALHGCEGDATHGVGNGHGDRIHRDRPTVFLNFYSMYKIIKAGGGRSHTVVVTEDGNSLAFGWNKHGQLGSGSTKNGRSVDWISTSTMLLEVESSPVRCLVSQVTNVHVELNSVCGYHLLKELLYCMGAVLLAVTAGLPQYGQLGHGTDNESVRLVYEAQPRPRAIATLSGETIVKAAGANIQLLWIQMAMFTVGLWVMEGLGTESRRMSGFLVVLKYSEAQCSSSQCNCFSWFCGGQCICGANKNTGDDWMYPKPLMDLRLLLHKLGHAQYGELGYGPAGQSLLLFRKSRHLEGMHVISVPGGPFNGRC
ncbi:cytochrome P450 83B1-like [Hibiscus syriacus]|uniref:Cytochrome P450 83B1-like n=1 Tax=Hibiscus syriacus TaxID=106335 RepID=A0A6A3B3N2_HIBSY|nr:cytochrome P450 83B1-like [Hibiscus syriacus]